MAKTAIYNGIDRYVVRALCLEPLHVGSASGDRGEVLIHPVENVPFIQAAGISGAFRSCYLKMCGQEATNELFGAHEGDRESRLRISDGKFEKDDSLHIELRPRVKINPTSGTVASSTLKGAPDQESGHKFDMQYVGAGAKFSFDFCLYGGTQEENENVMRCLAALDAGEIQFGGQKSSGCGYVKVLEVRYRHYDMKNASDRRLWRDETGLAAITLPELKPCDRQNAYEIRISAVTENELLVKGIAVENFGKDAPKAVNIQNVKGDYIIPGSSFKGSIRNRMEMIARYMGIQDTIIYDGFGKASDTDESGISGNLRFRDVVVADGEKTGKNMSFLRTRIRIDKFTGGVVNGALFTELNVAGELDIRIQIADKNHPDAVAGLLFLALRDLGYKLYALGSGQNVGKGYVDIRKITVCDLKNKMECELDSSFSIRKDREIIDRCMSELKKAITVREAI